MRPTLARRRSIRARRVIGVRALRNTLKLLETTHDFRLRRIGKARLPVSDADFAHVDVAARVERKAVRRQELAGVKTWPVLAAESSDALALRIDDGQARSEIRDLEIDRHARPQFPDDEVRLAPAATTQSARTVQVLPLRLVFAVTVEHLHAMIFPVGDVDPAVLIGHDVVDDVELAGVRARLAPGHDVLTVGRILVHAGITVAVGHVDLALG